MDPSWIAYQIALLLAELARLEARVAELEGTNPNADSPQG